MTQEERDIKRDRMRYTKNSTSSLFAFLAIILDVIYFISIYRSDVGTYYYTYIIGISVVYNLLFMLTSFLCEEGVKNYKKGYSYPLLILAVFQIIRIFIIPANAVKATVVSSGAEIQVMSTKQFIILLVYLIATAVCLVASAIVNLYKCSELEAHAKKLQKAA